MTHPGFHSVEKFLLGKTSLSFPGDVWTQTRGGVASVSQNGQTRVKFYRILGKPYVKKDFWPFFIRKYGPPSTHGFRERGNMGLLRYIRQ